MDQSKSFYQLYRKDTEHLYHAFMYSIVILLSGIYPFYAMLSLLVTIILNNDPFIRDFVTLNKSVINYLPRCSYHLL